MLFGALFDLPNCINGNWHMDTEAQPKSITVLGVFINNKITEYGTNKIFECLTYGRIREVIEGKLAYLHLITNEYGDMYIANYILYEEKFPKADKGTIEPD